MTRPAILHLESSDKALLLPRIYNNDKIENPTAGMIMFNSEKECLSFYNGDKWSCVCTDCGVTNPNKGIATTKDRAIPASEGCPGILDKDPSANGKHGTYYFTDDGQNTFASYCYMSHGGWTLVWSFSGAENYLRYDPERKLNMNPQKYAFIVDNPMGKTDGPAIPFNNFRLSKARMQQIAKNKEYYVHITKDPENMFKGTGMEKDNYMVMKGDKMDIFTLANYANRNLTFNGKVAGVEVDDARAKRNYYGLFSATSGGPGYNPESPHIDMREYMVGKGNNGFGYVFTDEQYKHGYLINCRPETINSNGECRLSQAMAFPEDDIPYIMWFMR